MICPNCGKNCPDSNRFCDNCGTAFAAPQSNQQQNNQQNYYQNNYQQNGYQQPPYQPNGCGNYRAPIKKRDIAMCIVLSIITCGIYGIYWEYCIVQDSNTASNEPYATSGGMVILLSIVTCGIYGLYWVYKNGNRMNAAMARAGLPCDTNKALLYVILNIFGLSIVTMALMQDDLNRMASLSSGN